MKKNVSDTSIHAFHERVIGEKQRTQNAVVLHFIKLFGEATCRMISRHTGIENSDCARCLNELWSPHMGSPVIVVSKKDKCPITGVRVKWYKLVQVNGVQMNIKF